MNQSTCWQCRNLSFNPTHADGTSDVFCLKKGGRLITVCNGSETRIHPPWWCPGGKY